MIEKGKKTILVVGATGRQGGAAARHLIHNGWKVRAMTRDGTKPNAVALRKLGVDIVEAHLEDRSSLESAMEATYGVFGVITPYEKGVEEEAVQGMNLVDAALNAGVEHFVYSSVGGAERNTGIPHFESKWTIERHLMASGVPHTVLRPVFFMENFCNPMARAAILSGRLESTLDPSRSIQMIAVDDIGGFASMVFDDPERWKSKAIEIAGDEKTMPEVAEAFSRTIGIPVKYVRTSLESIKSADSKAMFEWFQKEGYRADIGELRRMRPETMDFQGWLNRSGWKRVKKRSAA
ncbi:MAG TPA: NmrA/HSCARG family protein [Methanomassiliicoccales archaeon]|jgi:uncharacterized protein YbjT (DUF2867 family)